MIRILPLLALFACTGPDTDDPTEDSDITDSSSDSDDTGSVVIACTNFSAPDSGDADALPTQLSETGCVDSDDPWQTVDALVPFDINVPFWSDNAVKTRFIAIPTDGKISVYSDGDFEFPNGTTLMKHFQLQGKKIETRLFIKHANGIWGGYSYEWNEAETEATMLTTSLDRDVNGQTWSYPSQGDCTFCHAAAAGGSLGPEIGQINMDFAYSDGTMNQIEKWNALGWFDEDPGAPSGLEVYPDPSDTSNTLDERARAYLHTNCSQCHRPGGASHLPMDWRISAPMDSNTCDAVPNNPGSVVDARVLAPGDPSRSLLYVRPNDANWRMPPVGSNIIHTDGVALIGDWITSITACPTN